MSSKASDQAHEFALFSDQLVPAEHSTGTSFAVRQPELIRRLTGVLRVAVGQHVVFFDTSYHMRCIVEAIIQRKVVELRVVAVERNIPLAPRIHWLLPILERSAFEEALAGLTVLGATTVQPVVTRKVHRRAYIPHELERLGRIMIAAAEQAKQFILPAIKPIVPFESLLARTFEQPCLFFDPLGQPAGGVLQSLLSSATRDITCMVGPEGDLTQEEKAVLKQLKFSSVALTPTILRAKDAVFLATGLLRTLYSGKA